MPLQFPAPVNQISLPAIDRAVNQNKNSEQNREWNALRMQGEQQRQVGVQQEQDDPYGDAKFLMALGQEGATQTQQNPEWFAQNYESIVGEFKRRGIPHEKIPQPGTVSTEDLLSQFQQLHDAGKMGAMGAAPEAEDPRQGTGPIRNYNERGRIVEQFGEGSPQVQRFDNYVRANKVQDIGGVPNIVPSGGGAPQPLSTLDEEAAAANRLAMAEGEGGRGRTEGAGGGYEPVAGTQAAIDVETERRKRGGGAFMKSIQAQTVVEDVFRLNDQLDAGTVPFGRNAKIQADLHPSMQSDGYRNASSLIESVKGNVGIDSLLRIKATGAGLGQVPQSQLDLLSRLLGELDLGQEEGQFRYTWDRMRRVYEAIMIQAEDELIELGYQVPQVMDPAARDRVGDYGDDTPTPGGDDFQTRWDAAQPGEVLLAPDGTHRKK
jgi:hypothetical protein